MRGYGQFCPVAKASEVFAEKWTPLILRDMLSGAHRFSQIEAGVPRMSRSLLAQRLRSLERDGIIERRPVAGSRAAHYYLTPAGEEFREVIELLGTWGRRWITTLDASDLDVEMLMDAVSAELRLDRMPERRAVLEFRFRGAPKERWWILVEPPDDVDLCLKDPGREPDLVIATDVASLTDVHLGRTDMTGAIRTGLVELEGARWAVRGFPGWFGESHTVAWEKRWSASLHRAAPTG